MVLCLFRHGRWSRTSQRSPVWASRSVPSPRLPVSPSPVSRLPSPGACWTLKFPAPCFWPLDHPPAHIDRPPARPAADSSPCSIPAYLRTRTFVTAPPIAYCYPSPAFTFQKTDLISPRHHKRMYPPLTPDCDTLRRAMVEILSEIGINALPPVTLPSLLYPRPPNRVSLMHDSPIAV